MVYYKYVTANVCAKILQNRTLRWSSPATLNDPLDMQFRMLPDIDSIVVKTGVLESLWQIYSGKKLNRLSNAAGISIEILRMRAPGLSRAEFECELGPSVDECVASGSRYLPIFHQEIEAVMNRVKVLCLTEEPNHTLMWSHYAGGHGGAVLGFRCVQGLDSPYSAARPVQYVDQMPALFDSALLIEVLCGQAELGDGIHFLREVYTKYRVWEYEKEWRICTGFGRNAEATFEDCSFHALELESVTFGCRATTSFKEAVTALVRTDYPHVEMVQARVAAGQFAIERVPC